MENKKKQQLAEETYPINTEGKMWMPSTRDIENANKQIGFIAGCGCTRPEIDALIEVYKNSLRDIQKNK